MAIDPVTIRFQRLPHGAGIALPEYMTEGSAAADLRAAVTSPVTIDRGALATIPTGFAMEIPAGWQVEIRPRSGLAVKYGVTVINAPATIDADYRGEVQVALVNLGAAPFRVERGMRIAQVSPGRVTRIAWQESEQLTPTARGRGGFGHSGV